MFRKKRKIDPSEKAQSKRAKRLEDSDSDDNANANEGVSGASSSSTSRPVVSKELEMLVGLRKIQDMRRGKRGVEATPHIEVRPGKDEEEDEEEEEEEVGLLSKQFKTNRNLKDPKQAMDVARQKDLDKFIKQRMGVDTEEKKETYTSKEAALYAVPADIKLEDRLKDETVDVNMNWTAGLVEVEVSADRRIENLVASESAKKTMLRKVAQKGKGEVDLKQNTESYGDSVLQENESNKEQAYGSRFQAGQNNRPANARNEHRATDEDAVARFRAQMGKGGRGKGIHFPTGR